MKIFLDMDEVVADFSGYAENIAGKILPSDGGRYPIEVWREITRDPRIYSKLPVKAYSYELVHWCNSYCNAYNAELFFLTALPRNNDVPMATWDKVLWVKKYFIDIPVIIGPFSHDKYKHCNQGDILIDDRLSNCEDWKKAGGRSFQYKNWQDCKVWLEETLDFKV